MCSLPRNSISEPAIFAALIFLVTMFARAGMADASLQNPQAVAASNSLPSQIVTSDGAVYHLVKLIKVEPDGLLVQFQPGAGGIGVANLKFPKLPGPIQKQFGYDPVKAAAFEQAQAQAEAALSRKLRQEDKASPAAADDLSERPNLNGTVSVNNSDPTVTYAYYLPGQKPDDLGEHTAVTQPHFTCHADFTFHTQQNAHGQPIHLVIATVTLSLGLSCHIIEPMHPYEFVSRHEEGHRKICEYFYRSGPEVAQVIGDAMIGKQFESSAIDVDAARAQILAEAQNLVRTEYMLRLYAPAMEANRYYDQLNDPEGKHMDVDEAVQETIVRYGGKINLQRELLVDPSVISGNPAALPPDSLTMGLQAD